MIFRLVYSLSLLMINFVSAQNHRPWQKILSSSEITPSQQQFKIDSIIIEYEGNIEKDSMLERLTHKYAIWLYRKNKIDSAIHIAKYSQQLKKKKNNIPLQQHGLDNLGFFAYKNKDYDESIKYYEQCLHLNDTNSYGINAYSEIGKCYREKGDYYKSKTFFELAGSLFKKNKDYAGLIRNAINSRTTYQKLGSKSTNSQGIKNLLFADSIAKNIKSKPSTKYNIKNNLGILYTQNEDIEKASQYYNEALIIAKKIKDSTDIAATYGNLGNLYNDIDPVIAIAYQKTALDFTPKKSSKYPLRFNNMAYCQVLMRNFKEGINNYKKAIRLQLNDTVSEYNALLTSELISKTPHKSNLLISLTNLGQSYIRLFKNTKNNALLDESIATFMIADQLVDLIRIESQELSSKLYWRKQSSELYGKAIEACFLAQDETNAFYFMEKNKALLLTEDLTNTRIKQSLKLPQDLVNRETELQKKIYFINNVLKTTTNQETIDTHTIELLAQKRSLKVLQDSIQTKFTNYTNFDLQSPIATLKSIQASLDEDTVILEYNISDDIDFGSVEIDGYKPIIKGSKYGKKAYSKAYLLCITKNEHYFIELPNTDQLKSDTQKLIKKASIPFKNKEDIITYHNFGYRLFDQLFPTKEIKALLQDKKVRIIPDSYLNYLPFEALVTNPLQENNIRYLIEDSEIGYAYSNSFLKNTSDHNITDNISFIGFAPTSFEKYNLISLENSATEITNIKKYFTGEIFTNGNASKKHFLSALKEHTIIHLATHADAMDSITPWVAFSDEKIVLDELYLTKNNADLVVLSGCNTLKGKQETGEGVMSLARGFFHSGAKSVISSLWNVDDRSTAFIMNDFYKNLKDKKTKSQALREAKLSYLKNSSLSERSPHFWATFVLLGDPSPIAVGSFLSTYWLLLLIPIVFIAMIMFFKKQRK